jgi:hypothetical protein
MFKAQNLGKEFVQLVQVKNTLLKVDVVDYDGEGTHLLEYYTTASEEDGIVRCYASIDELADADGIETVDTLTVMGGYEGTRCYTNSVTVLVADDGTKWMDLAYNDLIFA